MDGNLLELTEGIKHSHKTVGSLLEEYGSLLLKSTATTGDSDDSVKQSPFVDDAKKRLMDIDLAMEYIQQEVQLALKEYLSTQSALPTSQDCSTIQSDDDQTEDANVTINQQVKLSDYNNDQNEAKLNRIPELQALFTGTLPDDFYLHLISVMGIQACLLSNRLVCSFWNELVLERCHNQKSLKLFENFSCLMEYGESLLEFEKTDDTSLILKSIGDDLLFEGLETNHDQLIKSLHQDGDIQNEVLTRKKKLAASKVLTTIFPKIKQLVLFPEDNTLIDIEHVLQFYAEQLTSLTMPDYGPDSESTGSKLRAFSFSKLKSLNTFWFSLQDGHLRSILPQLESLTMDCSRISLETLLRTGTQLQELNINDIKSVYTAPVAEFSKRPPINTNLRKFTFRHLNYVSQVLEFISQNMTSLECLKMDLIFDQANVSHLHLLSPYLLPLTQLHSLTLEAPVSFFLLDDNQLTEIKPLPSVRQLKLLLWNYASLPRESMDLFSRALFTAFPNAEQAFIGFVVNEDADVYDDRVDTDTLSAFENFAGKHPNVVKLFRSKYMSKFTNLPNAVSPLLGHHRQVYEEYIQEEELFGVAICKLAALLATQKGEDVPNLKILLRPADRLTALSNLCQLLDSKAFTLTYEMVKKMIEHMFQCSLKYGPSEDALFSGTCKCILFLLDSSVVTTLYSDKEIPFLHTYYWQVYPFFEMLLNLVEHSMTQQLDDKNLLLQLCKRMFRLMKEFDSIRGNEKFDDIQMFMILLKLARYYKTHEVNVLDNDEEKLPQIRALIDDQLQMFNFDRLGKVLIKFIRSKNRVHRVEMARALLRCGENQDNCFEWLSRQVDSDSSDSTTSDSSSAEDEP